MSPERTVSHIALRNAAQYSIGVANEFKLCTKTCYVGLVLRFIIFKHCVCRIRVIEIKYTPAWIPTERIYRSQVHSSLDSYRDILWGFTNRK